MADSPKRLSERSNFTGTLTGADLMHVVNGGASYKTTLAKLVSYFFSTAKVTAFAGGGQASATTLTAYDNLITTCATLGDSVKLEAAVAQSSTAGATRQKVRNNGTQTAYIYPQTGENIIGFATNSPYPLAPGGTIEFTCFTTGEWQY